MIDFHIHSSASDGTESPAWLVETARNTGINSIALTDHDTVSGVKSFLEAGKTFGVKTVPGVEISTWYRSKEIHIVGLFIDPEYPQLVSFLESMRLERKMRNRKIIQKLQSLGYEITEDEVAELAGGESLGRPHIARLLIEKHYFSEIQDVFDVLLKRGGKGYIPRMLAPPETACSIIHNAGGIAIWAHPVSGYQTGERAFLRKMLKVLMFSGIDGIETRYSSYTPFQSELLDEMADKYSLLKSGGSDFHGKNRPSVNLGTGTGGLIVPDHYSDAIESFLQKRNQA